MTVRPEIKKPISRKASATLFRAVDLTELGSIRETGRFAASPNGTEYKGFFYTSEYAQRFSDQQVSMGGPLTVVVKAIAPNALIARSPTHCAATEGPGVLIHIRDLAQVVPQP